MSQHVLTSYVLIVLAACVGLALIFGRLVFGRWLWEEFRPRVKDTAEAEARQEAEAEYRRQVAAADARQAMHREALEALRPFPTLARLYMPRPYDQTRPYKSDPALPEAPDARANVCDVSGPWDDEPLKTQQGPAPIDMTDQVRELGRIAQDAADEVAKANDAITGAGLTCIMCGGPVTDPNDHVRNGCPPPKDDGFTVRGD